MRNTLLVIGLLASQAATAQFIVGQDTTLCPGQTVTIDATDPDSSDLLFLDNTSTISLQDDQYSGVVNIGFNFTFYGNTYSQIVVGTNGIVTFDLTKASGYCPWGAAGQFFPNSFDPMNSIMLTFSDFAEATHISYQTIGTAPNRQFIVIYQPVTVTPCSTTDHCWYEALILHETTNYVDMHILNKPSDMCSAVQGMQNSSATAASIIIQDPQWTTTEDAKRWTPVNNTSYTISAIPFQHILDDSYELSWVTPNGAYPYSPQFTPTGLTADSNAIYLAFTSPYYCVGQWPAVSDVSYITISPDIALSGVQQHDETCYDANDGYYHFNISGLSQGPHTIFWEGQQVATHTFTNLAPGTYMLEIVNGYSCSQSFPIMINEVLYPLDQTLVTTDASVGQTGSVAISATGGTPPYQYSVGGPYQSADTFDIPQGAYNAIVMDHHGCTDTVVFMIGLNLVSVNELNAAGVSFYPNPVESTLNVITPESGCLIVLTDATGKTCYSGISAKETTIDISKLKAGIYRVRIEKDRKLLYSGQLTKL